ncbi:hypothetical protein O181_047540 [Austropuccinia psidii MF-1]|uniref:Uncharacterized protein n=1 Tax=Austropuccinia psidii MF-1 TaxID=1389203 RepID=A0A9Q3DQE2_9BASI|nr:hypothetical protein [Austropuccinia psidii MF-1]
MNRLHFPSHPSSMEADEFDDDDDDILPSPSSSFFKLKVASHQIPAFQLPDLRFEQSYLQSLMPFFSFNRTTSNHSKESTNLLNDEEIQENSENDLPQIEIDQYYIGPNFCVNWKMVILVTIRDQGSIWGSATIMLSHLWRCHNVRSSKASLSYHGLKSSIAEKPTSTWKRFFGNLWGGFKPARTSP